MRCVVNIFCTPYKKIHCFALAFFYVRTSDSRRLKRFRATSLCNLLVRPTVIQGVSASSTKSKTNAKRVEGCRLLAQEALGLQMFCDRCTSRCLCDRDSTKFAGIVQQ